MICIRYHAINDLVVPYVIDDTPLVRTGTQGHPIVASVVRHIT